MATQSNLYKAPFAPGGAMAVDAQTAQKLLSIALAAGRGYAEILVFTSEGKMAHDVQPLVRFGVRVITESNGKRQEGSSGGGGRTTLGYFEGRSPEWHAKRAAEQAIRMLDAQDAPAGQMEVVL